MVVKRFEVYLVNLDPTIGAEIRKTRPGIIVSEDAIGILPLRIIVPITDWKARYEVAPWMVQIMPDPQNGLSKPSAADAFQIRSISSERFLARIGKVTTDELQQLLEAVQIVIGLG